MKYYQSSCGKLLQYNPESKVYRLRNTVAKQSQVIEKEIFDSLETKQIKKDKFSQLMNEYFKTVEHEWIFDNSPYMKLPNFEEKDHNLSNNYILGKQVPYHKIKDAEWLGNVVLVYHWGKVYYHTISYNGYPQGQLIDPVSLHIVRWARLKHCAPIVNTNTNKIQ